jgi:two-component system sensor histidine kinase MprB
MKWYQSFSLRRRIAALVAGGVLATVIFVGSASWLFARHYLLNQTDANLINVSQAAASNANLVIQDPITGEYRPGPTTVTQLSLPFRVIEADGTILTPQNQTVVIPTTSADLAVADGQRQSSLRTVDFDGRTYRVVTVKSPRGTYALQVAQDIEAQQESLHKLALLLIFIGIAGAAFAASLGALIARASLQPVRQLTRAAERVAQTDDLASPIELGDNENSDDEVARLAQSFNAMLAALALSRERQRALVADAGHELRTPLTSLRTNIELLAREDPTNGRVLDPADKARLLSDLTAQTAELASLIGDLTDLAREDSSQHAREDIDLAEIAARAVARVRRRAPEVRIVTDLEASHAHGRPQQLERAITNLLDNAVKWSPAGGEVFVGLHRGELVVADQGPGIAPEDRPHVFERFYRATTSRDKPGSGLGLAIVAQAAAEHGGSVQAGETPTGGTLMRFTIPLDDIAPTDLAAPAEPQPVS